MMRASHPADRTGSVAVVYELYGVTDEEMAIVEGRDH